MISIRSCQHQAPAGLLVRLDLGLIRVIRLADMRSLHSGFRVIEHPVQCEANGGQACHATGVLGGIRLPAV